MLPKKPATLTQGLWDPRVRTVLYVVAFFLLLIGAGVLQSPIALEPIAEGMFPYDIHPSADAKVPWLVQAFGMFVLAMTVIIPLTVLWVVFAIITKRGWGPLGAFMGMLARALGFLNRWVFEPFIHKIDRLLAALFLTIPIIYMISFLPTWHDAIEQKLALFLCAVFAITATVPPDKIIFKKFRNE